MRITESTSGAADALQNRTQTPPRAPGLTTVLFASFASSPKTPGLTPSTHGGSVWAPVQLARRTVRVPKLSGTPNHIFHGAGLNCAPWRTTGAVMVAILTAG